MASKEKIIIVDGNALVHRAFHGLPPTMKTKSGQMTNAVYGFVTILFKVLKELKPKYGVVTFDLAQKTFRHKEYKEYKATRKKQPDELYTQFPIVKEIVRAFNIPIYEKAGFEADDLIGTLSKEIDDSVEKFIVTGDMDTLQLVDETTKIFTLKKGINDTLVYDIAKVKERFNGLDPEQMIDYKALRGDPSDNIPGVRGIGEKGAITLLNEYKTLENIYKHLDEIKGSVQKKLNENKEQAELSKRLATIVRDVPIEIDLKKCELENYEREKVISVLQKYELKSLLSHLQSVPQLRSQQSLFAQQPKPNLENKNYHLIDNEDKLKNFLNKLKKQKIFALDTETDSLNFINAQVMGLSFSWQEGEAYFINLIKNKKLLSKNLIKILEDSQYKKIGQNIKYDWHVLENAGINLQGVFFDTMIASYLLNPGSRQHSLDKMAFIEFGYEMMSYKDLCGTGKKQISIKDVPQEKLNYYACEDADYTWRLYEKLKSSLEKQEKLEELFFNLEMPLVEILKVIERNGVIIDEKFLNKMNQDLKRKIIKLEKSIYKLAGTEFNIASPLQLKEILFDKLNINSTGVKKIKTGLSTAAAELFKLRDCHKIIPLIEEYRELTKLTSTYVEALPKLINKKTNRVHASFNQTITATGRLSSSDPNLQNIPIRTELGEKIRQAFIAPNGYKLLAVDYSQIELRIIASLSGDEKMIDSFQKNEDIHSRTAADINDVSLEEVSPELRRAAKAINFGIIYGMGAYGLSQDAGISRYEAQDFIDKYFFVYKDVYKYLENTKSQARLKEYVETLFGRRRYLPDINSGVFQIKQAAERMAINMPVQGTAADLMKMAMLKIQDEINNKKIKAKIISQVHDELVFEIKENAVKTEALKIKQIMENIHTFKCPIIVNIKAGDNWKDMVVI